MDKAKKPAPDIFRLLKIRPTKIPRTVRETPVGAEGPPPIHWKLLATMAGIIAAIVLIVYGYSLTGTEVFNDGLMLRHIVQTSDWNAFWAQTWGTMFTKPLSQQWLTATYAWDYLSAGASLIWFHIVNVLFHLLACLYLFLLVFRVARNLYLDERLDVDPYHLAFAAAAIFACHPLTVESVAYLGGRAGTLTAVNYFLSLNCFLLGYLGTGRTARTWGYLFAFVFMAIGLTVSPDALTLPLSMIALAVVLNKDTHSFFDWWLRHPIVLSVLALGQAALPFLILRGVELQGANGAGFGLPSLTVYYATQLKAVPVYYLRCFLVPAGLSFDPPYLLSTGFTDVGTIAGAGLILAACAGMYLLGKRPILSFGLYLFVVGLVTSGMFVQPELMSDRRFYLPLAGLCLIAGWLLAKLATKSLVKAVIACSVLLVVLSGLTIWREVAWNSNTALAEATVKANPKSALGHTLMAIELVKSDNIAGAEREAKDAMKYGPNFSPAYQIEGSVLLHKFNYKEAEDVLSKGLKLAQDQHVQPEITATIYMGLAEALLPLEKVDFAIFAAQQALEVYPESDRMHLVLAKCYIEKGKYQDALLELQTARKLNEGLEDAWEPITIAAYKLGYKDIALPAAERWVAYAQSDQSQEYYIRAGLLAKNYQVCHKALEYMLKEKPDSAVALAMSAIVYEAEGKKDQADAFRKQALSIDPAIFDKLKQ